MKVTRVASHVSVEQTMSWEQDGGEQLRAGTETPSCPSEGLREIYLAV